jgi:hypothetical protein
MPFQNKKHQPLPAVSNGGNEAGNVAVFCGVLREFEAGDSAARV